MMLLMIIREGDDLMDQFNYNFAAIEESYTYWYVVVIILLFSQRKGKSE